MPAAPASNVAEFEHPVPQAPDKDVIPRKTSSETIADHAISILANADAHVDEALDALQRRLNEVKAVKSRKLDAAKLSIREFMEWSRYCTDVHQEIGEAITRLRGDEARQVQ